jgi:DNA-binding response OmpR family regulator
VKVLLVDDDRGLLDLLRYALERDGYTVVTAGDGEQGLRRWAAAAPDLAVLDVTLPKLDGFEVCRRIRDHARTPIVLLTARGEEAEVRRGLELGADDYLTKPFSMRLLLARLEAVLRRSQADPAWRPAGAVRVGDLVLDLRAHAATKAGRPVALTPVEFRLLWELARHAGQVLPYGRLAGLAGRGRGAAGAGPLKAHVSALRRKLRLVGGEPGAIEAVPGVGYRLTLSR